MGRRLTANTVLAHPETGSPVVFEEGQEVPAWAADLITTPGLLEGSKAPSAKRTPKKAAAQDVSEDEPADEDEDTDADEDAEDGGTPVEVPPTTGNGSGVTAWRKYALSKGFEFDDDVKRAEIIAALTAENIPVE